MQNVTKTVLSVVLFLFSRGLGRAKTMYPLLAPDRLETLVFEDIPRTRYQIKNGILRAEVNKSASFFILPFKKPSKVKRISFRWKERGSMKVKDAYTEKTKEGDDALFRTGLITLGKPRAMPWFIPEWLENLRNKLKNPPGELHWFVAGSRHRPGQSWESPWSGMIQNTAVSGTKQSGWMLANFRPSEGFPAVVGMMFGSDGDNSGSEFVLFLEDFQVEFFPE